MIIYTAKEKQIMLNMGLNTMDINNLEIYVQELLNWNQSINLISKNSEEKIWSRHIIDSLYLKQYIDIKNTQILDIGTGAGLPGLVLAIIGYKNITLLDKNSKKISFLNFIAAQLQVQVKVLNQDIKSIHHNYEFIIARGFSDIETILILCNKIPHKRILLMKGSRIMEEINTVKSSLLKQYSYKINYQDSKSIILDLCLLKN